MIQAIAELFRWDYQGQPFVLFGPAHLIALGVILAFVLSFFCLRSKAPEGWRRSIRVGMAVVLIVNELAWHLWNAVNGQWSIQTMLPLHLCSLFVFLSAAMLVTRSYPIFEFAYFLGIGGALQALITPDAGIYGFPHFRFIQTMLSHGLIVSAALFMLIVENYRPTWRSLGKVALWGNVYMLVVFGLNLLLGSNYMYLAHKPATASAIDFLGPWPLYLLWLELIALALFLLMALPFVKRGRLKA